jgi:hypothetical protein
MVVREVGKLLSRLVVQFHHYLDDWLIRGPSREVVEQAVALVVDLCQLLGLVINPDKSEFLPRQRFQHLGVIFDTVTMRSYVPMARRLVLAKQALMLSRKSHVQAFAALQCCGRLVAAEPQVPLGRLHLRAFQRDIVQGWMHPMSKFRTQIWLSPQARADLEWWSDPLRLAQGASLLPFRPQVHLFTDASLSGWGAHLLSGQTVQGEWPAALAGQPINLLELQAVWLALRRFRPFLVGQAVQVHLDNTVAAFYINKQGGTRNPQLLDLTRQLLLWAESQQVALRARYIPGKLNVMADSLSRRSQILTTEWSICPRVLQRVWQLWHRPLVDLFATRLNAKLPLYVSPCPDPEAWAIDALSFSWEGVDGYAYPPTALIPAVLQQVAEARCRVILVAPFWPSMRWFHRLLNLLVANPLSLPAKRDLLKQSHNNMFHPRPESLHLHAWLLSGPVSEVRDFQIRSLAALPVRPDALLL